MKTTELNMAEILCVVECDSTSDYTERNEVFTFKQRPVKSLEIHGKDKKGTVYFYDGTISNVFLMDSNRLRGEVVNNTIDEALLFEFVKKFNALGGEYLEYTPNAGTVLYAHVVEKIIVTNKKYEVLLENGVFSERYLV